MAWVRRRSLQGFRVQAVPKVADMGDAPDLTELPPLPSIACERLYSLVDAFPDAYGAWDEPWELRSSEYRRHFQPARCSPTYGELDQMGIGQLLHSASLGPDDTFVDVGSGLGKLVVLAAALTAVGAAWGIELSPSRHKKALRGADQLRKLGVLEEEERKRLHFARGNCGQGLRGEALDATHLILTLRNGHGAVQKLVAKLQAQPLVRGHSRTIWSVAHWLPQCPGLTCLRRYEISGYVKPPQEVPWLGEAWEDEGGLTRSFAVYEYSLTQEQDTTTR